MIKDPDRFANEVIPQYFDHNKFSSFTRQLNFYKFTREQSKVIKKNDNSSEIAKHQTFHHKFFKRGRPDLLKHLQRSKKIEFQGEDGGAGQVKRQKISSVHRGGDDDRPLQEQVFELMQRASHMEQKIQALEQENSKLTFSVQTLQHQDEMKQRAILALEDHVRRLELQMTNALQQHLAQMQQMNQPLPFGRESSLSAVNPSTLMRYLSMGGLNGLDTGALSQGITRLTTPPRGGQGPSGFPSSNLSRVTTPPRSYLGQSQQQSRQFNAASAAESLVANEAAASCGSGPAGSERASLPRHPEMKRFGASAEGGSESAAAGDGSSLPRHPRVKQFGGPGGGGNSTQNSVAPPGHQTGVGGSGGPSLPRHPRMKQFGGVPQQQGNFANGIPNRFSNNLAGDKHSDQSGGTGENQQGNDGNANGTDSFDNAVTREESFGISSLLDLARGSSLPV